MLLILDGDILVFKYAVVHQTEVEWKEGIWTTYGEFYPARGAMFEFVEAMAKRLDADAVLWALTDNENNFRKKVYPAYKSTRVKTQRPVLIPPLRHELLTNHAATLLPSLEADDVCALMATQPVLKSFPNHPPEKRIICSIDKDFGCVPGKKFNWDNPEAGVIDITPGQAARFHLRQTLTGDTTDGYPGCKGIGPVKADKILDDALPDYGVSIERYIRDGWEAVVAAYKKAGFSEQFALAQARCAYLLQTGHWTQKEGAKLWTPPVGPSR